MCEKDIITVAPCMYCRLVVQGSNFITKLCCLYIGKEIFLCTQYFYLIVPFWHVLVPYLESYVEL